MTNIMEEKHFCRCCITTECYKDMANVYYIGNKTENYFEMLMDTFSMEIPIRDTERCLICEECVSKLRDATAFKRQVYNVQEIIKNKLCWNECDTINIPKVEDEDDDFDDDLSDSFTDKDFMWDSYNHGSKQKGQIFVIELESKNVNKVINTTTPKLRSYINKKKVNQYKNTKNTSPILGGSGKIKGTLCRRTLYSSENTKNNDTIIEIRNKKSQNICEYSDDSIQYTIDFDPCNDGSTKNSNNGSKGDDNDQNSSSFPKRTQTKRIGKTKNVTAELNKEKANNIKKRGIVSQTHSLSKHKRDNTVKLLVNSNLCLFRSFQNKFGCNFCQSKFPEFCQLREHTANHSLNPTNLTFKLKKMRGLTYKNAEISNLKCNLCSEHCTDLTELTAHLKSEHDISFHGTEHYLVPYKLQNGFQCVSCDLKFNSYLRLSIHMNTHYANNVCEMCGQSFINRLGLRAHVHSMHKEKKCSLCPTTFLTNSAKVKHLRQEHNIKNTKRYCNLCNKTFRYTYMLDAHKVSEHGAKRQVSNCSECGKAFFSENNLRIHLRSVHVKERNYPCSLCGMRFFTKCDQKRHESTHEDVRSFSCSYCESKFKSKDSWRRHLKRQHGHVFGETS